MAVELCDAAGVVESHDTVQSQSGEAGDSGCGPAELSDSDGCGHPALSGCDCARWRRSVAASGTYPRYRSTFQLAVWRDICHARNALADGGGAHHGTGRTGTEDEQVRAWGESCHWSAGRAESHPEKNCTRH